MNQLNIDNFKEYFKSRDIFGISDIADFYYITDKNITQKTINGRIYSLVQKGVLQRVGRGKFLLGKRRIYIPEISSELKSIYHKIHKEFPFVNICVWETSILNEFMRHQAGKSYYLIETEKDASESIFYALKEKNLSIFFNPNQEILSKYATKSKDTYIVKTLVSEAPLQKIDEVWTVSIEKILVDIFCDETLFAAQQGAEMRIIFNEAFRKYTINQSKMLRYADRRKRRAALIDYLRTISNYRQ